MIIEHAPEKCHYLEDNVSCRLFLKTLCRRKNSDHKTGRVVERFYRPEKIDETSPHCNEEFHYRYRGIHCIL